MRQNPSKSLDMQTSFCIPKTTSSSSSHQCLSSTHIFGESTPNWLDAILIGDAANIAANAMKNNTTADDLMEEDNTDFKGYQFCGDETNQTQKKTY